MTDYTAAKLDDVLSAAINTLLARRSLLTTQSEQVALEFALILLEYTAGDNLKRQIEVNFPGIYSSSMLAIQTELAEEIARIRADTREKERNAKT